MDIKKKQQKALYQFNSCLKACQLNTDKSLHILEFGFKDGLFLNVCKEAGMIATGLEVCQGHYDQVTKHYPQLNTILYDGNKVPLADESFDLIVSFQVLEHVGSIDTIINESLRLLKPGGIMYHVCPNYHSFYEGHFKVLWLPFLSEKTGRIYLKLLGRYSEYYETLNIVKPATLRQALKKHKNNAQILSLGKKQFKQSFNLEQISKVNHKLLRGLLKTVYYAGPVKWLFLELLTLTGTYYPLILIAKKQPVKP
ncbi:MAG: methyltransferase domain-containing protein [Sedimentisphaerales bacterium]|nr:methyltransferase domain-containing protein [Sedimentisphaerales bacterium]MBN2842374.1 methyltransferase domain-containing protein [Sedimentisphaerales bacterium]